MQRQKHITRIERLLVIMAIDHYHDEGLKNLSLLFTDASTCYELFLSSIFIPQSLVLRLQSRQRRDTIHHILKGLLVLLGRISRSLSALDFLSIIPLNLKGRQDDTRVEAVDVLIGVRRQAF